MANPPRVGEASSDHRSVCAFSLTPNDPQCTERATVHILSVSTTYGPVGLASCDGHSSIARLSGRYEGEHVFTGFCGFPSALWQGDHCDLDVALPDRPRVA